MAIQNDNTLVTKGDLKDLYSNKIAPYLGANLQMKTNVSDYFSEDEKIVGVWTDGKPVYQITIVTTLPTASAEGTSGSRTLSIANLHVDVVAYAHAIVENTAKCYFNLPWPFPNGSAVTNFHINPENMPSSYETSKNYLVLDNGHVAWNDCPVFVTFQYTKTTDAANSAVTTPGCYDINFPNTWPENKEIYFGNGLYGYRATGTTGTGETQFVIGITINYLVSSDGVIYNGDWHIPPGNWAATDNYITRVVCNSSTGLVKMNHSSGYNSKNYDVWFTYTK